MAGLDAAPLDEAGDDDEAGDELPDDAGFIICPNTDAGLLLLPPELGDGADVDGGDADVDGFSLAASVGSILSG